MDKLKAGVAKTVITPPIGVRLSGFAHRVQPSIGVLDDLYARALVLESGNESIAIVVCDLLWLNRRLIKSIKKTIEKKIGLREENVMISCTHTHYGPDLTKVNNAYIEILKEKIIGAIYSAVNSMTPARIGFAKDGCCYAGSNRRNPRSPYGPYYLYSWPEGPIDPEVTVMLVKDEEERNLCALVNYACHPVTLGSKELRISKDYPNYVVELIEDVMKTTVIFVNGCCGNINPNWIWDKPYEKNPPKRVYPQELKPRIEESRRIGLMVGASALKALSSITKFESSVRVSSSLKSVDLPVRSDIPETIKNWMKPHPLRDHINEVISGAKSITTEVQVFRINGTAFIGLPGEVFVEYQLELKKQMDKMNTLFVSELANDCIYYVPTPEAYEEGGYEPTMAIVAPNAGNMLVSTALEMLQKIIK